PALAEMAAWTPPPPVAAPPVVPPPVVSSGPPADFWAPPNPGYEYRGARRSKRWLVILAGIASVAAIAAAVVVLQRGSGGPTYPAAWDPRVAPIAQFVQAQRGLKWKHPVPVKFLASADFDALIGKENAPDNGDNGSSEGSQVMFDSM